MRSPPPAGVVVGGVIGVVVAGGSVAVGSLVVEAIWDDVLVAVVAVAPVSVASSICWLTSSLASSTASTAAGIAQARIAIRRPIAITAAMISSASPGALLRGERLEGALGGR